MDYANFDLDDPDPGLCVQRCGESRKCMTFTYVRPGFQGQKARCWLKTGVPTATRSSCRLSGIYGHIATPPPPPGQARCGNVFCGQNETCCPAGCRNLSTDPQNCGVCNRVVPSGWTCQNGVPTAPPRFECTTGREVVSSLSGNCPINADKTCASPNNCPSNCRCELFRVSGSRWVWVSDGRTPPSDQNATYGCECVRP